MWEQTEHIFLDSLARVLHAIARILPGVLAMLLIIAIATGLALALRSAVRRLCERIALDRRLRQWGMAAPAQEGGGGPSQLISRLVAWTVLAVGFLAGLSAIDAATTSALALRLLEYMPHVVVAVIILVVGVAGSRVVERSVLIGAVNMGLQSARLLGLAARWLVVILAAGIALEDLGVGGLIVPVALAILFGGIVLALSLAVGLGAKDIVGRSIAKHFTSSGPQRIQPPPDEERVQHL